MTVAAWLIILGSVFVVFSAFGQVSAGSSLETRERIETLLSEPPADGLGLAVDTVLEILRVVAMVAAAAATATAILGTQVLQRSRSARLWLSVLAVPLFLSAAFIGGFMGALVAAAVVMLWLQPARSWFAGEPLPERFNADGTLRKTEEAPRKPTPPPAAPPTPEREHHPVGHGSAPQQPPTYPQQPYGQPGQPAQPGPAPYAGFGQAPAEREQASPYAGAAERPAPTRRPGALSWACALTWIGSGLVSGFLLLASLAFAVISEADFVEATAQQPELAEQIDDIGWTTISQIVFATTVVSVLWSVFAVVVAVLAFRGSVWARVALTISTGALAGVLAVLSVGNLAMLVVLLPVAATFLLLLRPDVRSWRT
ncbi:hypothetical protein [Nocardioides cremeus]|uniref:hypothetical protein n=2 Tax=Nocardioides TaxID=1839 RepID=UPI002671AAA6|nr:hypothetical protein [Nocardioides cremeus]